MAKILLTELNIVNKARGKYLIILLALALIKVGPLRIHYYL